MRPPGDTRVVAGLVGPAHHSTNEGGRVDAEHMALVEDHCVWGGACRLLVPEILSFFSFLGLKQSLKS